MTLGRKTFSSIDEILGGARYIDDLVRRGTETAAQLEALRVVYKTNLVDGLNSNTALKNAFNNLMGDASKIKNDNFRRIMSALPEGEAGKLFEAGSAAARRADELLRAGGSTGGALRTADELTDIDTLAGAARRLSDTDATTVNRFYREMSDTALDAQADAFVDAGEQGMKAFKNLPIESQNILLKGNQRLRYKAKRTTGLKDKMGGACKSAPVFCDIGKGLGGLGAAVGVGFALEAVYDNVMDELDNDDDVAACISTCYPNDWYDSKASGVGDKEYKDLDFKTIEGLRESTGNDDINQYNTPLCTASMTGATCATMCNERCEDLNRTFIDRLFSAAGDAAGAAAGAAGGAAGEGLKALLDGIFGEGMGIPAAIGIFIFFIVIIIISTMM